MVAVDCPPLQRWWVVLSGRLDNRWGWCGQNDSTKGSSSCGAWRREPLRGGRGSWSVSELEVSTCGGEGGQLLDIPCWAYPWRAGLPGGVWGEAQSFLTASLGSVLLCMNGEIEIWTEDTFSCSVFTAQKQWQCRKRRPLIHDPVQSCRFVTRPECQDYFWDVLCIDETTREIIFSQELNNCFLDERTQHLALGFHVFCHVCFVPAVMLTY